MKYYIASVIWRDRDGGHRYETWIEMAEGIVDLFLMANEATDPTLIVCYVEITKEEYDRASKLLN